MKLECEIRHGRYFLVAREDEVRWAILRPGAPEAEVAAGYTREEVKTVALLAGFSTSQVDRAIRVAEAKRRPN